MAFVRDSGRVVAAPGLRHLEGTSLSIHRGRRESRKRSGEECRKPSEEQMKWKQRKEPLSTMAQRPTGQQHGQIV